MRTVFRRQEDVMASGGADKVIENVKVCKGGVDASFYDDVTMIPDPSEHDASKKICLFLTMLCLDLKTKWKLILHEVAIIILMLFILRSPILDCRDKRSGKTVTSLCSFYKIGKILYTFLMIIAVVTAFHSIGFSSFVMMCGERINIILSLLIYREQLTMVNTGRTCQISG